MGLSDTGYQRRNYEEILNGKIQRAKELFGEDIDTSGLTPLGKFIRINAYDQALAEEDAEAIYYARFPNTASGQSLDRLAAFSGLARNPAEAASYSVRIMGAAGYTVPAGFLVGTDTGLTFYAVQDAGIGEDGQGMMEVCCTEAGTLGNASPGAINRIINPDANVSAAQGQECLSPGVDEESDTALRARMKAAILGAGSGNENAIRAALLRVPTVQFAAVVVNDGDTPDGAGRPPHSFQCYVLGGEDYEQEIGEAIFEKRPVGIQTVGDVSVNLTDAGGNQKTVKFSYAPETEVTVKTKIKTSAAYPGDGSAQISSGVAGFINGLGIGHSLVLSTLYQYIYSVPGVTEVTALEVSTDGGGSYTTDNVSVPTFGVAVCAGVNVEVAGD